MIDSTSSVSELIKFAVGGKLASGLLVVAFAVALVAGLRVTDFFAVGFFAVGFFGVAFFATGFLVAMIYSSCAVSPPVVAFTADLFKAAYCRSVTKNGDCHPRATNSVSITLASTI